MPSIRVSIHTLLKRPIKTSNHFKYSPLLWNWPLISFHAPTKAISPFGLCLSHIVPSIFYPSNWSTYQIVLQSNTSKLIRFIRYYMETTLEDCILHVRLTLNIIGLFHKTCIPSLQFCLLALYIFLFSFVSLPDIYKECFNKVKMFFYI